MKIRHQVPLLITVVLLVFEAGFLSVLVCYPYLPDPGFADLGSVVNSLLAPASTVLLFGLMYAPIATAAGKIVAQRLTSFRSLVRFLLVPFKELVSQVDSFSVSDCASTFRILSRPRLLLAISLMISSFVAFIPYRPDLNPTGRLVGIDSSTYVTWITQMTAKPPISAIQYAFVEGLDGSRPLLLILLYLTASAGLPPQFVIECLPIVLAPLLALSSYVFVRFGYGNAKFASLTALASPFSFYIIVGLWGGYYANLLGLTEAYLFLTILLISKSPNPRNYATLFVLSIALFLTHPWTWVLVTTTSLAFAYFGWKETGRSFLPKAIIGIIVTGIVLDVVKSFVFSTQTLAADLLSKVPSGEQAAGFWVSLIEGLMYTHGGLLANWLILGLVLLSVFALSFKNEFERLLILWVGVSSVPFLFLDSYHKARIVYDLPIPALVSFGMVWLLTKSAHDSGLRPNLLAILVLVTMASYVLQGMLQI